MANNFWDYPLRKHHKLSDQIRPLITSLVDAFGISHFSYFFVTQGGHSACLSSHPAWLEHYLHHELFLHSPFLDNRLENIEAAQKLGFDAILFVSQQQLQKELAKRGLL